MHPIGHLTHTRSSDGAPESDEVLKAVTGVKTIHYRPLYLNHPDPMVFMSVAVDTSGRIYDDCEGVIGFDFGENFGHEDFYTARFVMSVFYTTTVFYSFQTLYTTFSSFPCFSSSHST